MSGHGHSDRAQRTLYVTGFNAKYTTKRMLEELFMQGGPVVDVTMFPSHAYILFNDEESVSYCLALFKDIELHGQRLVLHSRSKDQGRFCYVKYLMEVRNKLMSEFSKIPPPDLPAKRMPEKLKQSNQKKFRSKKKRASISRQQAKSQPNNFQKTKDQTKKMLQNKTIPAKQKTFKQKQIKQLAKNKLIKPKNKNSSRKR